ncbi:ankyrin repeat-containing domain protein [Mycena latifolia]|nr:ankyrin repeat-containing domain protein [Mycena latifolia]
MAELLGLIASIVQLVDTFSRAVKLVKDVHNAPKEQRQLFAEIQSLQPLVVDLQDRLVKNAGIFGITRLKNPLLELETTMKQCNLKLRAGDGPVAKVWKALIWSISDKKEAKENLEKIERFKSLLNIWLTMDIWDVGQQQKTNHDNQQQTQQHSWNVPVILDSLQSVGQQQQTSHHKQQLDHNPDKRAKIIEWMSPLNFSKRQADILSTWQPGTGGWLLADPQFQEWESSSGTVLHCRGMPGAGKTVLVSLVVKHLESRALHENIGVACAYLNHKETESQTPQNLLGALWQQLVLGKPIHKEVATQYKLHHERGTRLPADEICTALMFAVTEYSKVYFAIDALDEYPEEKRNVFLEYLTALIPAVNLMVTSRPHINMDMFLHDVHSLDISAATDDICQYVDRHISKSSRLGKHLRACPELHEEIKTKMINNTRGMFLLAKLHMDSLATKNTVKAVREALNHLPKDLEHTYNEAMQRVDQQNEDDRQLAHLALTWVAYAKHPLSVGELQEALAIEPQATALDPDNLLDIDIVLSACTGLIIVDEAASIVRLVHYTTQNYLETSGRFSNAQTKILSTCLTYLAMEEFLHLPVTESDSVLRTLFYGKRAKDLVVKHPLLQYGPYCLLHATGELETNLQDRLISFLEQAHRWRRFWGEALGHLSLIPPWTFSDHWWGHSGSPVCLAISCNIHTVGHQLLSEINKEGLDSALYAAASNGNLQLAQFLIKGGATVNMQGGQGRTEQHDQVKDSNPKRQIFRNYNDCERAKHGTPLHAAAVQGDLSMVQLLIKNGASVNAEIGEYGTALAAASYHGHKAIVQLLINEGADVNVKGGDHGHALQAASSAGHQAVVQLLINNGAEVNTCKGQEYGLDSALQAASYAGHQEVVKFLLTKGANINMHGGSCGSALQAASLQGHDTVIRLLITNGANVNAKGGVYGSVLQAASYQGDASIVHLLVAKGAEVNAEGGQYGTALQAAAAQGHEEIALFLLKHGADVNINGGRHGSAIQAACMLTQSPQHLWDNEHNYNFYKQKQTAMIKMLIQNGANVNPHSVEHETALQITAAQGDLEALLLLLEAGANVNQQGENGDTALQTASRKGHKAIVQLLIDHGADVNVERGKYGTALQAAVVGTHLEVAELLLQKGADVNKTGGKYGSALWAAVAPSIDIFDMPHGSHSQRATMAILLLNHGAKVDAQQRHPGTLLHAASSEGDETMVLLLINNGADVNWQNGDGGTALHTAAAKGHSKVVQLLVEKGGDVNTTGGEYGTPILAAVVGMHDQVVKFLVENGADVKTAGGKYGSALHAAFNAPQVYGELYFNSREKILKVLIENGANNNFRIGQTKIYETALQTASAQGREGIVLLLIEGGVNINAQGGPHGTALQAACRNGRNPVVQLLVRKGANVDADGDKYGTALQAAAAGMCNTAIQFLLENGADVNKMGGKYGSALHAASRNGNKAGVQILVEHGADVNAVGGPYRTALQAATIGLHDEVVRFLIENGADVNKTGGKFKSPVQIASRFPPRQGQKMVELLVQNGADTSVLQVRSSEIVSWIDEPGAELQGEA